MMLSTHDLVFEKALRGLAFGASSGVVTPGAGDFLNVLIANPSASGVQAALYAVEVFASLGASVQVLVNPTTDLPVSAATIQNLNFASGNAPALTAFAEVSNTAMSGGTDLGSIFATPQNAAALSQWVPLILEEDTSIGLIVPGALGLTAFVNGFWIEL